MRHQPAATSPDDTPCPIARSLGLVGESWSVLILREAFYGMRRFDEFQKRLGIAPNMLTRRLHTLVDAGLLERRKYSDRPPRCEYVLTDRGRDFRPVLLTLLTWGNRHFATDGEAVLLVDRNSGERVDPVLVDRATGRPITIADHVIVPGPGASESLRAKLGHPDGAQVPPASACLTSPPTDGHPAQSGAASPVPPQAETPQKEVS
jgi:DNA-binding HxlR family transcriptional regulator